MRWMFKDKQPGQKENLMSNMLRMYEYTVYTLKNACFETNIFSWNLPLLIGSTSLARCVTIPMALPTYARLCEESGAENNVALVALCAGQSYHSCHDIFRILPSTDIISFFILKQTQLDVLKTHTHHTHTHCWTDWRWVDFFWFLREFLSKSFACLAALSLSSYWWGVLVKNHQPRIIIIIT